MVGRVLWLISSGLSAEELLSDLLEELIEELELPLSSPFERPRMLELRALQARL